jgi:hypothetical protein
LILEIVVISLIGWEIYLGYLQEHQQAENFNKQQQVLTNLGKSSEATATTLTTLEKTTEIMSGAVERNAIAAETSSKTATRAMHVSERAYVTCVVLQSPPKADAKWSLTVQLVNSGRTTATELVAKAGLIIVPKAMSAEDARNQLFSLPPPDLLKSESILGSGQQVSQVVESNSLLANIEIEAIEDKRTVAYLFVDLTYKDIFDRQHRSQTCVFYLPSTKSMVNCAVLNKAD